MGPPGTATLFSLTTTLRPKSMAWVTSRMDPITTSTIASRLRIGGATSACARRASRPFRQSLRGVLIDVAGSKNVEALPSHYEITVEDLPRGCLSARNRKRAATGSGTPLERAAGRPWPCSIKIEPRDSEAALRVTRVGQAEGRQAADHSRRNIVKLAPCQLPDGGFLVVCEIFPARHVAQEHR